MKGALFSSPPPPPFQANLSKEYAIPFPIPKILCSSTARGCWTGAWLYKGWGGVSLKELLVPVVPAEEVQKSPDICRDMEERWAAPDEASVFVWKISRLLSLTWTGSIPHRDHFCFPAATGDIRVCGKLELLYSIFCVNHTSCPILFCTVQNSIFREFSTTKLVTFAAFFQPFFFFFFPVWTINYMVILKTHPWF